MGGPAGSATASLVGRDAEVARLERVVHRARSGAASTLLVSGLAGVGKTSLMDATLTAARDDGLLVLRGAGLPLASLASPFRTLRGMLRGLPDGVPPAPLSARRVAPETVGAVGVDPVELDSWLDEVSADRPVVVAVDDVHWVDRESLDVLRYVVAGGLERPVGVVLTLRSEEVGDGHPLHRWLADVRRLPGFDQLDLAPLDRLATEEQMAALLGRLPQPALVDEVYERSAGNPYLTRLLVTGLDPTATELPGGAASRLEDAVLAAWHGLSPGARELTTVLAVAGQGLVRADIAELVAWRLDPERVPGWLAEAVARSVMTLDEQGTYWFHHPLQAELLEARTHPDDRREWHEACAVLLRSRLEHRPDPSRDAARIVAVADHYDAAGMAEEAVLWSMRVASGLDGRAAPEDVARALRRVIDLRTAGVRVEPTAEDLLWRLRDATARAGDLAGECEAVEALLEHVDRDERPDVAAELLVRRIHLLFLLRRHDDRVEDAEEAVAVAAGAPGTRQQALALAQLGFAWAWALGVEDHAARAVRIAEEALAVAERTEDHGAVAHALSALAMASIVAGDLDRARRLAARAHQESQRSADLVALYRAASMEVNTSGGGHPSKLAVVEAAYRDMGELGAPYTWLAMMAQRVARHAVECGEVATARGSIRFALGADPGPTGYVGARISAGRLALLTGDVAAASQHLTRVLELTDDGPEFRFWGEAVIHAELLLATGEPRKAVDTCLRELRRRDARWRAEWLLPLAARGLADLAEATRSVGEDPADVEAELAELERDLPPASDDGRVPTPIPSTEADPDPAYAAYRAGFDAWYAAELARGRRSPHAHRYWARAVARLDVVPDLPWEAAYAWMRLGEAHLVAERPDRRAATRALRTAVERARPLEAAPVLDRVEALAREARIDLSPGSTPVPEQPLPSLTPREREVLAHVLAGRTYAEIADALCVTEKTVSTHISNMLRKTGAANRHDLAARARNAGERER